MIKRTPWGRSDNQEARGDGITFYSTPRHGGFYVIPKLLNQIPLAWRNASFNGNALRGWFEEDCDWSMVALSFSDRFTSAELEAAKSMFDSYIAPKLEA